MIFIGIDPGQSGGVAIVDASARHLFSTKLGGLAIHEIVTLLESELEEYCGEGRHWRPNSFVTLERVHSMPKQGVASSFKFGQSFGVLQGILAALYLSFQLVTPQAWQKAMGCLSRGDKNVTKAKAFQLYPEAKITHATADAILLARYGWATWPRPQHENPAPRASEQAEL